MILPAFITKPNPDIYLTGSYLVLDFETYNNNKGDARHARNSIVTGVYYSSLCGWKEFDANAASSPQELQKEIERVDVVVAQNAKFEIKWLIRLGLPIHKYLFYDTMLGDYVIAGNRGWDLDLDSVAARYGIESKASAVSKMIKGGVCPSTIPFGLLRRYCQKDVEITRNIFLVQRQVLKNSGLLPVFFLRCLSTPVLADIEMVGMGVDRELVVKKHCEFSEQHWETKEAIKELSGGIVPSGAVQKAHFLYGTLKFEELRDRRGRPIRGRPHKQFPEGIPKTDEVTILALKAKTATQKEYIRLCLIETELKKKINTYTLRFLQAGDVLYGTINQTISQTHRLTSSNPNLQNIDRTLKKLIKSRHKGWKIRSADFKQLEFRAAAQLAQDKQALEDIVGNADIHAYTAKVLTEAGQPTSRQEAKASTFKPLYGGSSGTEAEKRYYEAFKKKYWAIAQMQKEWTKEVLEKKQLRTISGLIFYWPDTEYTSSGYLQNTSKMYNYPVQMFATADIAPTSTCLLWHHIKAMGLNSFIINEVHDSVLLEEHPKESQELGNLLEFVMSKYITEFLEKVIDYRINYPLEIEQKSCTNWDDNIETT